MPPLKALLISDHRPGHFSLSEGIVAAIARARPVDVHWLEVKRPRFVPARLLSTLANWGVPPGALLKCVYGVDSASLPKVDLIVSSGGDTIAANISAARVLGGVPNLFYGSLRRFNPDDFALVLNSYARYAGHPKYLVTLKPNKLDPDEMPPPSPPPNFANAEPPRTAGLLLGGDTPTMTFGAANWQRILDFVRAAHVQHGTRWMVSNSRRTPTEVSAQVAALAAQPSSPISRFVDVLNAGSGTLREIFAASDAIAVTADSSSMLSEAIWVRRPVISLTPAGSSLPPDEQDYRTFLSSSGWTAALGLAELSPDTWLANLARLTPLSANPLDLLAADLQRRLPGLTS